MTKAKISKDDLEVLKERGYVEGNPSTIPENISPVLREQLVQEWAEKNDVTDANELPSAVDRGNAFARERAAAEEGDKPFGGKGDHDGDGKTGGVKRQGDAASGVDTGSGSGKK